MKNQVFLIGHLGQNPESRTFQNGGMVAEFSLATQDGYRDPSTDEWKETTDWHRVKLSGRLAQVVMDYCQKGSLVFVGGKLKTERYTDREGTERRSTYVRVNEIKLLSKKDRTDQTPMINPSPVVESRAGAEGEDDLPF